MARRRWRWRGRNARRESAAQNLAHVVQFHEAENIIGSDTLCLTDDIATSSGIAILQGIIIGKSAIMPACVAAHVGIGLGGIEKSKRGY